MTGFFEELKRRKVYRVAIAYIVAGWALAQGLAQVLPVFDISNSVIRVVIALLLIGFPVALVLAWVFDFTPQGIKATPSIASAGRTASRGPSVRSCYPRNLRDRPPLARGAVVKPSRGVFPARL